MRILIEYGKTLVYNGLAVNWIIMAPTSNNHNLFYIWGIHKQFFALDFSEERLSFLIKIDAFKAQ